MNFAHPHFAEPRWLWLAFAGPVLLFALHRYSAWARRRQLAALASPQFVQELTASHSAVRRVLKEVLCLIAVAGIGIALARPQWGVREITSQSLGEDIVFAVDCSRSMLAADVSPNRLERAKLAVQDFVRRHGRGRVGLVAFAGQAFLQCPLTFDHGAFEDSLLALDDKTIVVPGTDVGRALDESFLAMEKMDRRKIVVLITDGEDLEKSGVRIAKSLAEKGVVVFAVGVGTEAGAEIRVMNEQGQPELVRDSKGEVVRSRLDETTLRAIATATKGDYHPLGALGEGLAKVRLAVESKDFTSGPAPMRALGVDRYHWIIAAVLGLLILESLIGTRRRARMAVMLMVMFMSGYGTQESHATNGVGVTNSAVEKTVPEKNPENAREFFNAGTRKLHEAKLREAETFLQSALASQQEKIQQPALYNLGHVRFAQGDEELKKTPSVPDTTRRAVGALDQGDDAISKARDALDSAELQKIVSAYLNGRGARKELKAAADAVRRAIETRGSVLKKWQRSLGDFKSALELNPNDRDAQRNVEIVEKEIAKLIDSIRQLQQAMAALAMEMEALGQKMKELRGKIPDQDGPPGSGEDEDEEEDRPNGPREGQQEGKSRDGEERGLTPEEAGWLLDGFKPGGNKHLPMGQGEEGKPKDRKGRNW